MQISKFLRARMTVFESMAPIFRHFLAKSFTDSVKDCSQCENGTQSNDMLVLLR